jgi:hypothetical protein
VGRGFGCAEESAAGKVRKTSRNKKKPLVGALHESSRRVIMSFRPSSPRTSSVVTFRCLTPTCSRPRHRRGLCPTCYGRLCQDIRKGLTTWQAAEAAGLILPVNKAGQRAWSTGFRKGTRDRPLEPTLSAREEPPGSPRHPRREAPCTNAGRADSG